MTENGSISPYRSSYSLLYRIADALLITGSLWASTLIMDVRWTPNYSIAVLLAVVMFFMFAGAAGLYHPWRDSSSSSEAQRILHVWVWVILGLLLAAYTTKHTAFFSRRAVTAWFIAAPTLAVLWRLVVYALLHHLRTVGINQRRVLIAGSGELGQRLLDTINANSWMNLEVAGIYDDEADIGSHPVKDIDATVLGDLDDLVTAAKTGQCDEIYLALPVHKQDRIRKILDSLSDSSVPVHIVPDLFTYSLLHATWRQIGSLPVVSVYGTPHEGMGGILKRSEDLVLGTLILIIIAIPMLLIAAAIKMTSPGPVLFKQRRYGLSGDEVYIWKFRTMNVCEDDATVTQATRNDPRVTALGTFLRRTSLDELPQFFNVLQGHMSIVGPRPHAVVHNESYRTMIPGYMLRHIVKPGITGWAQINGCRGETKTIDEMKKRVEYDLDYIQNWSLLLDLKIIVLTIFKGFVGRKAY